MQKILDITNRFMLDYDSKKGNKKTSFLAEKEVCN